MDFATADLSDSYPNWTSCDVQFVQFGGVRSFYGKIRTIQARGDNALLRKALEKRSDGEVMVVDAEGYLGVAMLGGNLASLALHNGWKGIVIFGAVRDTQALKCISFGVKALGVNPRRSTKQGTGRADVPVRFGGSVFTPGDWLYSDEDGLLLSPQPILQTSCIDSL